MPTQTPIGVDLGDGVIYVKFDGDWATRQVAIHGDVALWMSIASPVARSSARRA